MLRSDRLPLVAMILVVIALALTLSYVARRGDESPKLVGAKPPGESKAADRSARARGTDHSVGAMPASRPAEPEMEVELPSPATLTLQFRCSDQAALGGIVLELLDETGGQVGRTVSDERGIAEFAALEAGTYRWRHDGSRAISPVPVSEVATLAMDGERVAVRPGADLVSGRFELAAGERRRIEVPVVAGCIVTGRVSDALGALGVPVALKLISRERLEHPGGTDVERIVGRQARRFDSGEFRFTGVRSGEVELLGYYATESSLAQVRCAFHLEAGETRDLGLIAALEGRDLRLRLSARDARGETLSPETIFGRSEVRRVVEIRPENPDETWPYQKIELPMDREILVQGLPESRCVLRLAEEDALVNEALAGWQRGSGSEFEIPHLGSDCVELHEDWRRESILELSVENLEHGALLKPRLQLIDLDHGVAIERRLGESFRGCRLHLVEGRYRVLLGGQVGERFVQADSGTIELQEAGGAIALVLAEAGRLLGRSVNHVPLRIEAEEGGPVLEFSADPDGSIRADLPPGRYRVYGHAEQVSLVAGQVLDLGEF